MANQGLWIKLLLLAVGLLASQGVQAQCSGSELIISPENVATVEDCTTLEFSQIKVLANVTSIDLSKLTSVNDLWIQGDSLQSLTIPNLETVSAGLKFENVHVSINFASLRNVSGLFLDHVGFPSLSFPVLDLVSSLVEMVNCTGVISDNVFPAQPTIRDVAIEGMGPLTISGLNGVVTRNIRFENVDLLTVSGFNGNITGSEIDLRYVSNSEFSGFNGAIVLDDGIYMQELENVQFSGFNGALDFQYGVYTEFVRNSVFSGFSGSIHLLHEGVYFFYLDDCVITGFNGLISAETVSFERFNRSEISGFNGVMELQDDLFFWTFEHSVVSGFNGPIHAGVNLRIEGMHDCVVTGFNTSVTIDAAVYVNDLYDTVISGFNGPFVSKSGVYFQISKRTVLSGFNGGVQAAGSLAFTNHVNTVLSGFNGPIISGSSLQFVLFENTVVSGFNGDITVFDTLTVVGGFLSTITGFNGRIDTYALYLEASVACDISGFNAVLTATEMYFQGLFGVTELSGFNGHINVSSNVDFEDFGPWEECSYSCYYLTHYGSEMFSDYVAGINNNTHITISGFNGNVSAPSIRFEDSSSSLEISGFKGQTTFIALEFEYLDNLTLAEGSFTSLAAFPDDSDDFDCYYDICPDFTILADHVYTARIYMQGVFFHQPALVGSFHAQPTDAFTAHVFDVILYEVYNLVTIDRSFNGMQWGTTVVLDTMPELASVEHSYIDMEGALQVLYFGETNLAKLDMTSFSNLKNVSTLVILSNPSLVSVDALLNTPHIVQASILDNAALRSLSGLCGNVPHPNLAIVQILNNPALCCADLDQIFDFELYFDVYNASMITIDGCDNSTTCAGSHVCECASFDEEICPNGAFCTGARFGAQCLTCDADQIFNSSATQCQDCPAATFANKTTCEACSVFGAACTACDADQCTTCAAPAIKDNGVCRVCDLACQNNGKCTLSQSGQFCACPTGFGGALCQTAQTFDVVTETKQSANVTTRRAHFAVNKPFVVDTKVAKPAGVTIVDVDLLQVRVSPLDVVLYEPVVGQVNAGQLTPTGAQASLTFAYKAVARNLQVSFMPLASFLGSQSSAEITVEVEFLLSYTVDSAASSSVSKKVAVLRTIVPVLQSGEVFTTTITVEQAVTVYPTEEAADEAQRKEEEAAASSGSDDLSEGAIAGIVIGSVLGAVALLALGAFCMRRSSGKSAASSQGTEMGAVRA